MSGRQSFAFLFLCVASGIHAVAADLGGTLCVAGNPELSGLVARWAEAFQGLHPQVKVATHLTGSDTGMAALYTGKADVALLGRVPTPSEIQAFEWIFHYKPSQVEILTGSLDQPGKSPAPVLFVRHDNPLRQLSLAQLDAVFGTEHRLAPADIRTWGQLGLTGDWADKPIHLYAPDAMSGTGRFFRHVVLDDSRMMNWAQLTEFNDTGIPLSATHDAGRQIIAAMTQDRYGLAVSSLGYSSGKVRALDVDGIAPSRETLVARLYPLTRCVVACYKGRPGAGMNPLAGAFLRYVLSPAGQSQVDRDAGYLPLGDTTASRQLQKLDHP